MEANRSKFWMGLGLGSIIGVIAYRFSCSSKGKELKENQGNKNRLQMEPVIFILSKDVCFKEHLQADKRPCRIRSESLLLPRLPGR